MIAIQVALSVALMADMVTYLVVDFTEALVTVLQEPGFIYLLSAVFSLSGMNFGNNLFIS